MSNYATKSDLKNAADIDTSMFAKKANLDSLNNHDHDKYIATPEVNKITKENFDERFRQENLASEYDIAEFIKDRFFWKIK